MTNDRRRVGPKTDSAQSLARAKRELDEQERADLQERATRVHAVLMDTVAWPRRDVLIEFLRDTIDYLKRQGGSR